jgi:hypothetical protein
MSFIYTTGVPNPPNIPSSDVSNMQTNTNSINSIIGVDHVGFNLANGGYHTVIHQTQYSTGTDPAAIPSIGQLYIKQISSNGNTDEVLFYQSGGGRIFQLTGAPTGAGSQGSIGTSGWTFLPNGLIMQWGVVNSPPSSGSVTYPLQFPQNVFGVFFNFGRNASSTDSFWINTSGTNNTTQFAFKGSTGTAVVFYWFAIGN